MYKPPRCENCEYWRERPVKRTNTVKKMGECKKKTPLMGQNGYGYWPLTSYDDFCYDGKHIKQELLTEEKQIMENPDE